MNIEKNRVSKNDVTVVLPTLNEEEAIGIVIDELKNLGYNNILVVDGYSSDKTVEIARKKGVKVILQEGRGKGGAIKTAIKYVETPYMVIMDADYTYNPKDIERMLNHISVHDEVIGYRKDRQNIPLLHRLGNWLINFTFNLLLGGGLTDVCSGIYMLKTDTIKNMELKSKSFSTEVEIAANLITYGKVTEVPVSYRKRKGKSKLKTWRTGLEIFLTVIRLARAYNPVFMFATIASILTIPGIIILLWELTLRYLYGSKAWSIGMTWLGLILLIIGLQGFSTATIALMLKRMEMRIIRAERRK